MGNEEEGSTIHIPSGEKEKNKTKERSSINYIGYTQPAHNIVLYTDKLI